MSGGFDFAKLTVCAYGYSFGLAGTRYDKGTGNEFVAFFLFDIVLLAGDKSFVDFDGTFRDFTINKDLVAESVDDEVAFDYLGLVDLNRFAVSDDGRFLLGNEAHFVDGFFGTNFVDNADESVRYGDEDKKEIFVSADRDNHQGEDEIDKIKNR